MCHGQPYTVVIMLYCCYTVVWRIDKRRSFTTWQKPPITIAWFTWPYSLNKSWNCEIRKKIVMSSKHVTFCKKVQITSVYRLGVKPLKNRHRRCLNYLISNDCVCREASWLCSGLLKIYASWIVSPAQGKVLVGLEITHYLTHSVTNDSMLYKPLRIKP